MPFLARASSASFQVDQAFLLCLGICVAFLILVTFCMVFFSIRYSRERNPHPEDIEGSFWLESIWTVVPLVLFLLMFYYGWTDFNYMRNPPRDALLIEVNARQWAWSFKYPNGKQTDDLYLALGRPVKLLTHSLDVIHGFYIPAFRVKTDVVPGHDNFVWFAPWLLGDFDVECTVICGPGHSEMLSKVHVIPEADFKAWYFSDEAVPKPAPAAELAAFRRESPAEALLRAKNCLACHTSDGRPSVGPSFKGLYGSSQDVLIDGRRRQASADEEYLRKVIRRPDSALVMGYPPIMPPATLSEAELREIVDYIKALGAPK